MLTIRSLSKTYANGVQALQGVSLCVPTGIFGLLGPNGAGKSTLMRTIATLQRPSAGNIILDEIDVLQQPQAARRVLGFLPQDMGVYPKVTAQEALDYLAKLKGYTQRGERHEMVERLLSQTNLWNVRQRALGEFSGGMRQRFGVAQALIGNPRLVMVDEPTAGLDPEERLRILDLLCTVSETATVLLSTHIVDDVQDVCSRMAILRKGQLVMESEPADATAALANRVWSRPRMHAEQAECELPNYLCKRLTQGRHTLYFHGVDRPGQIFSSVTPTLEHVYFYHLAHHHEARPGETPIRTGLHVQAEANAKDHAGIPKGFSGVPQTPPPGGFSQDQQ